VKVGNLLKQTAVLPSNSEMSPEDILLQPNKAGFAQMILSNPTTMLQVIAKGACVGEATPVTLVDVVDPSEDKGSDHESAELPEAVDVRRVEDDREAPARQKALLELIPKAESLSA
jgi:hypothetical protein